MSGIFGIINRHDQPVDRTDLKRLRDAVAHLGPDGNHLWRDGCAGLGQAMLCSTAESMGEKLPWRDPASGLVIVADARVDNRADLERPLADELTRLKSLSDLPAAPDSWYILSAFLYWGEGCLERLEGEFSFAVWNPANRRLFCARDRMGARPLSYVDKGRYFAFSSDSESLLSLPGVSREPNEDRIATILLPLYEDRHDDRTWQADVRAVMPAHALTVSSGGSISCRRYWRLKTPEPHRWSSKEECLEAFEQVFSEAVRCRLRAPGTAAMMMSGGLDSAGLAATAHRLLPDHSGDGMRAYSAIDDHVENSVETRAILSLASSLGLETSYLRVPSLRGPVGIDDLLEAAWQNAHPVDNMLLLPAMMCLASAREGNRMLLVGASGDVATKLPRYYPSAYFRRGRFVKGWQECRAAARNNVLLRSNSPHVLLKQNLWRAFAPLALRKRRLRAQHGDFSLVVSNSCIPDATARKLNLQERLQEQYREDEQELLRPVDIAAARSAEYVLWGLSGFSRIAGRYGVESRDPWADRRVIEFFLGLPLDVKVNAGWTKYLVRLAFEDELEPEVIWRRDKEHLGWKFIERVMREPRSEVFSVLMNGLPLLADWIDESTARNLHDRWVSTGDAGSRESVFELVTLILWLHRIKSL